MIFVEGVQESILSVEACEKALGYPFDKNRIWYFYTKISLKMLLERVTKFNSNHRALYNYKCR